MDGCFFFCEVVVWCLTVATSFEVFVKAPPQNNSKAKKGDPKHLFGGKELLSVLASLERYLILGGSNHSRSMKISE